MRKFNLRDHVARRLKSLDEAPREKPEPVVPDTPDQPPAETSSAYRLSWRTDVGRCRKNNQDAVILGQDFYGVADGMGGHLGGEIASSSLRDGLLEEIREKNPGEETLRAAVEKMNTVLWKQQLEDPALNGMGTTLTVLWPSPGKMILAQVGDSRAYLLRDGELRQMTSDHSLVADMVRRGVLTEEQAACHPMRNYITRAVGTEETLEVDVTQVERKKEDRWLLCSDGLYGSLPRDQLAEMLSRENPEEAANALLEAALEAGGRDNITLLILDDMDPVLPEKDPAPVTEDEEPAPDGASGQSDGGEADG